MNSFRRRLRLWVAAWLVFQAASLSAFVPLDCCAAHRAAASGKPGCHETPPAVECPMQAADGAMCPMHSGHHADTGMTPDEECSMRGTCGGPMAALSALLSNQGVLPDPFAVLPDSCASTAAAPARENLMIHRRSPDPPPPRV